jgi:hypothetical protein
MVRRHNGTEPDDSCVLEAIRQLLDFRASGPHLEILDDLSSRIARIPLPYVAKLF